MNGFKAFRALLDTPRHAQTTACESGQVAVCAGLNPENSRAAVLLSNFNTDAGPPELVVREFPWSGQTEFELYLVDGEHDLKLARRGKLGADGHLTLAELKVPSVVLLKFSPLPVQ